MELRVLPMIEQEDDSFVLNIVPHDTVPDTIQFTAPDTIKFTAPGSLFVAPDITIEDAEQRLYIGDCRAVMRKFPAASFDSIVTDPPYELGFMGKSWDSKGIAYDTAMWKECLRVLKPGGYLLSFGGTRTYHRMVCAIEDAGFEIRDTICWIYGSGFPKSQDVSKAIDKAAGAKREVVGHLTPRTAQRQTPKRDDVTYGQFSGTPLSVTAPATDDAKRWQGYGTALKPAVEPIVLARKPFSGTVAANVLRYGTGAINIDGCRVGNDERINPPSGAPGGNAWRLHGEDGRNIENAMRYAEQSKARPDSVVTGRWPANIVLSHTEYCDEDTCIDGCPVAEMDAQSGNRRGFASQQDLKETPSAYFGADKYPGMREGFNDSGGASRFFPIFRYQAKAPSKERPTVAGVSHPTVKPLALMQWLVRLVTPKDGHVLDPFVGSGTTLQAASLEGMTSTGIESHREYIPLIKQRCPRVVVQ